MVYDTKHFFIESDKLLALVKQDGNFTYLQHVLPNNTKCNNATDLQMIGLD